MQPEITINDYPCGSGKTTAMIKSFKEDRKYLVILPLLSEVDRVVETATRSALANLLKMTTKLGPRQPAWRRCSLQARTSPPPIACTRG